MADYHAAGELRGHLLKAGEHTAHLKQRFVALQGQRFVYWESEKRASAEPPKGGGIVCGAQEWWPKQRLLMGKQAASGDKYDGRTFLVDLMAHGGKRIRYHLVAESPAQRLKWLTALVCAASEPCPSSSPGSPPLATGDVPTGMGGGDTAPTAAPTAVPIAMPPATPPAAPSASTPSAPTLAAAEPHAEIIEELPSVWTAWNDAGVGDAGRQIAAQRYAALLQRAPSCWQVLQDRGNFYLAGGELRKAEIDFSAALELNPERAELWNDRAACRYQACRHADALVDTAQALHLRPAFAQALSNRGNAHRALGHRQAAKAAYNAALLLDPTDARTWNNRGALQEDLGNLVAAELDIRRSIELAPDGERALANLARVAEKLAESDVELRPLQAVTLAAVAPRLCEPAVATGAMGADPTDPAAAPTAAGSAAAAGSDACPVRVVANGVVRRADEGMASAVQGGLHSLTKLTSWLSAPATDSHSQGSGSREIEGDDGPVIAEEAHDETTSVVAAWIASEARAAGHDTEQALAPGGVADGG